VFQGIIVYKNRCRRHRKGCIDGEGQKAKP